jgi:hypothetical protein
MAGQFEAAYQKIINPQSIVVGPVLVGFLKLGQFDDQPGC